MEEQSKYTTASSRAFQLQLSSLLPYLLEYLRRKRKALSEGNKKLLATTCIDLAELYMRQGRYDTAVDEFTLVADAYSSLGKEMDYGRANRMIGEAYMQLREFDKALSHQKIHLGKHAFES